MATFENVLHSSLFDDSTHQRHPCLGGETLLKGYDRCIKPPLVYLDAAREVDGGTRGVVEGEAAPRLHRSLGELPVFGEPAKCVEPMKSVLHHLRRRYRRRRRRCHLTISLNDSLNPSFATSHVLYAVPEEGAKRTILGMYECRVSKASSYASSCAEGIKLCMRFSRRLDASTRNARPLLLSPPSLLFATVLCSRAIVSGSLRTDVSV